MQIPGLLTIAKLFFRGLSGLEKQIERQNALLERLADAIAPLPSAPAEEPDVLDTNQEEMAVEEAKEERRLSGYPKEESYSGWNSPLPGG